MLRHGRSLGEQLTAERTVINERGRERIPLWPPAAEQELLTGGFSVYDQVDFLHIDAAFMR